MAKKLLCFRGTCHLLLYLLLKVGMEIVQGYILDSEYLEYFTSLN